MAIILNIETSTQVCSVALAKDGHLLVLKESNEKNSHAEILTAFIEEALMEANLKFNQLDAIAISKGPGSYTGLRIGMSTAKGLCYSLDKPLIGIDTMQSMAHFAAQELISEITSETLLVPMIDARRMEVYTAFYNSELSAISQIAPLILEEDSLSKEAQNHKLILTGDGCAKCIELFSQQENIHIFPEILSSAKGMIQLAEEKFNSQDFEDVAYFEPFYLKEFIAGIPRVKGLR